MRLIWSGPAQTDLRRIDNWLTNNAGADAAEQHLERIAEQARRLRDFPRAGPVLAETQRRARVAGTPYILIYQVMDRIEILRIRHDREDWRPQS